MKTSVAKIVTTKSGTISKNVTGMLANCTFISKKSKGTQNRIYTGYYSGSGRFTSAHSAMFTVKQILDAGGYKYKTGNDAKFGGVKGEYVQVSNVAFDLILTIKNSK
jgi:hypothetical protein